MQNSNFDYLQLLLTCLNQLLTQLNQNKQAAIKFLKDLELLFNKIAMKVYIRSSNNFS